MSEPKTRSQTTTDKRQSPASDPAVRFTDLSKRYGKVQALDGLSMEVRRGDVTALLGPNGAGKTTLMEILTGIRVADSGRVDVLGMNPERDRRSLAERLGVQVQEFNLQATVQVREALAFFASLHVDSEDVDVLLDRFGLAEKAKARFPTLSGGQKRRLAIAKALVGRPELVVLDEPTSGLDPQGQEFLRQETRRLRHEGRTVLLSTHDVEDAARLAEAVLIVDQGRIVATGSPTEIVRTHCHGWRAEVRITPLPEWSELPEVRAVEDAEGSVIYARNAEAVRALVDDDQIIAERPASLHDAYFLLTGTGLRS